MFGKGKIELHSGERECEKGIDFSAGCVKVESWLIRDQPSPGGKPHTSKGDIIMTKANENTNETRIEIIRTSTTLSIRLGNNSLMVEAADLKPSMLNLLAMRGLADSLRDSTALPKGSTTVDKWTALMATFNRIEDGTYTARTKGSGVSEPKGGILANALFRFAQANPTAKEAQVFTSLEATIERLRKAGKSVQSKLLNNPPAHIAPFIEEVRKEMVKDVEINGDSLLNSIL